MIAEIIAVPRQHRIPAGAMGPDPVTLDVRAHLVPHETGLVLVDTGMDPSGAAIDNALVAAGVAWSDLSHVVLTHGHPDHTPARRTTCAGRRRKPWSQPARWWPPGHR